MNAALDHELAEMNATWTATSAKLESATNERKVLEGIIDFCQHWFKEAEINLASDIRNSTSAEVLVEHISMVSRVSEIFPGSWNDVCMSLRSLIG